jgi:hypothetical protein
MEDDLLTQLQALGAEPVAPVPAPVDRAAAEKAFVEESGPVGAAIRGAMSGASFGAAPKMGQAVDYLLESIGLLDRNAPEYISPQRKLQLLQEAFPKASFGGEIAGGIAPSALTGGAASAIAGPGASVARKAAVTGLVEGAAGGATSALQGGDAMDIALGSLLGGTLGAAPMAMAARGASKEAAKNAAELAKTMSKPEYGAAVNQVSKLEMKLLNENTKLNTIIGNLESEKVSLRRKAESELKGLIAEQEKIAKEAASLRTKLEQASPTSKTSPEYLEFKQADEQVKRLQKLADDAKKKISQVQATAPTKLGAERERGIAAAKKGVRKAEERVFTEEEKAQINDALIGLIEEKGVMRQVGKKGKAAAEAVAEAPAAAAPAAPAPKSIKDLQQLERELIEDAWAQDPEGKLRALARATGINKDTLKRRLAKLGITKESAQEAVAARKAAAEAATEIVPPAGAAPAPTPTQSVFDVGDEDLKGGKILEKLPVNAEMSRKVQAERSALPARAEAAKGGLERAAKELQQAQAPIVATEKSRFAPELKIRGEQAAGLREEVSKAIAMREQALAALQQAQSPQSRVALQAQIANADQRISDLTGEIASKGKALEQKSYLQDLTKQAMVAPQQANVQLTQQMLNQAKKNLDAMKNVSPSNKARLRALFEDPFAAGSAAIRLLSQPSARALTDQDVEPLL